jgi:hypothetical protein
LLNDAQQLNFYSYTADNPITRLDPKGADYINLNRTVVVPTELGLAIGLTVRVMVDPNRTCAAVVMR